MKKKKQAIIEPQDVKTRHVGMHECTDSIGIHLLNPSDAEYEDAMHIAARDLFPTVYCHWDNVLSFTGWRE